MPERPGTDKARLLFHSSNISDWNHALSEYERAVSAVAEAKKRPELVQLDKKWTSELRKLVESRSPRHILREELSDIVKWKILRGRFRPLQKLVDSNKSPSVLLNSTKSFELLRLSDWKGAINSLMSLNGVGVATASAVLAAVEPELCPFMADEVIESTTKGERDYTMETYIEMQANLRKKAKELGPKWNAELVGRALWSTATVYRYIDCAKGSSTVMKAIKEQIASVSNSNKSSVSGNSSLMTTSTDTRLTRKRSSPSVSEDTTKKSRLC